MIITLVVPAVEYPVGSSGGVVGKGVAHLNVGGSVRNLGAGGLRGVVDSRHGVGVASVGEVGGVGAVASAVGQGEGVDGIRADKLVVIEPTGKAILVAGGSSRQGHLRTLSNSQRRSAGVVLIILNLDSAARGVVGSHRDGTVLRNITENCVIGKVGLDIGDSNRRCSTLFHTSQFPMIKNIGIRRNSRYHRILSCQFRTCTLNNTDGVCSKWHNIGRKIISNLLYLINNIQFSIRCNREHIVWRATHLITITIKPYYKLISRICHSSQ